VPPPEPIVQLPVESDTLSAQTEPDSIPVASAPSETVQVVEEVTAADPAAVDVVEPAAMQANDTAANKVDEASPQVELATSAGVDGEIDSAVAIEAPAEEADVSPSAQPGEQPADAPADASETDSNAVGVETATETA